MSKIDELKKQATEDILGVKIVNATVLADLLVSECVKWINDNVGMITIEAHNDLRKNLGLE